MSSLIFMLLIRMSTCIVVRATCTIHHATSWCRAYTLLIYFAAISLLILTTTRARPNTGRVARPGLPAHSAGRPASVQRSVTARVNVTSVISYTLDAGAPRSRPTPEATATRLP